MKITQITRRDIIDAITVEKISWHGRLEEAEFLSRLFNLSALPSTDHRRAKPIGLETAGQGGGQSSLRGADGRGRRRHPAPSGGSYASLNTHHERAIGTGEDPWIHTWQPGSQGRTAAVAGPTTGAKRESRHGSRNADSSAFEGVAHG